MTLAQHNESKMAGNKKMMTRVLDLDLDLFLQDCCPLAELGSRPALAGHEPWAEEQVRAFLQEGCGLSKDHPVPGRIFETHDQALQWWDRLIREGRLSVPFACTHADAHSDLGIGVPGPGYVLNNVLSRAVEKRRDLALFYRLKQLDEANYLLFALAMRYISELDNVRNLRSRPDIPKQILFEGRPDVIRLTSLPASLFEAQNGKEPEIPFHVYEDPMQFRAAGPYDWVSLAISPRYAPKEADALAEIIREYIDETPLE